MGSYDQLFNGAFNYTPEFLHSIGFNGDPYTYGQGEDRGTRTGQNPAFTQHLQDRGLRLAASMSGNERDQWALGRAFDAQGSPVGDETRWRPDVNSDAFMGAMLGGTAFAGSMALGAGAGAAGGAGQTAAEANAIAQINGSGTLLASSASGLPEGVALGGAEGGGALGAGAGYVTPGLGAAGAAGAAGGSSPLFGSAGLLGSGVSATDLGGYAGSALRFAGSPAGGAVIGALAGGLGAGSGLNSATNSTQNRLDPRLANYVYGQNGNSGLLGNVNNVYSQQLAQGGLNDQQRQGMSNLLGVLNSPTYQSGFDSMRNVGQGLLNQPQAGNPFTSGQAQLQQPNPQIADANRARMPYMPGGK